MRIIFDFFFHGEILGEKTSKGNKLVETSTPIITCTHQTTKKTFLQFRNSEKVP